eukprot:366546-Chlamydomonas_euryale.AAC.36
MHESAHTVRQCVLCTQNVHDADATGDTTLQLIAAEHCAAFAVQLMDLMADPKERVGGGWAVKAGRHGRIASAGSRAHGLGEF